MNDNANEFLGKAVGIKLMYVSSTSIADMHVDHTEVCHPGTVTNDIILRDPGRHGGQTWWGPDLCQYLTNIFWLSNSLSNFLDNMWIVFCLDSLFFYQNLMLNFSHQIYLLAQKEYLGITIQWHWARWRLKKSPVSLLFTQRFIQAQSNENIKPLRRWPFWEEFKGDRSIQLRGNIFIWWRQYDKVLLCRVALWLWQRVKLRCYPFC